MIVERLGEKGSNRTAVVFFLSTTQMKNAANKNPAKPTV
jgi:hypothetical protein